MRRSRRSRMIRWGILFLIYSSFQIYTSQTSPVSTSTDSVKETQDSTTRIPTTATPDVQTQSATTEPAIVKTTPNSSMEILSTTETETMKPHVTSTVPSPHSTRRAPRDNCNPPAIEQFPPPGIERDLRIHGLLIIHVIVAIFTFLGLAIVCDDYFVSSLDRICEELKLSPDVAGATFMAAGSSAPELATVIIGVFFAQDDIGVSGVIGSAVFNIMFVISVCALCTGAVCHLNWWPLVRDCFFYSLSILVMLLVMLDDYVLWYEAMIMLIFYVVYCIVLVFNTPLERWAHSLNLPIKLPTKEEQSALVTYKNIPDTQYTQSSDKQASTTLNEVDNQPENQPSKQSQEYQGYTEQNTWDPNTSWDPNAAWNDESSTVAPIQAPISNSWGNTQANYDTNSQWDNPGQGQENLGYNTGYGDQLDQTSVPQQSAGESKPLELTKKVASPVNYYQPKESGEMVNPLIKPVDGGKFAVVSWFITFPIHYTCRKSIPDCKTEKYRNWYPLTFIVSMIWISFYSYIMVWMITIIGSTFRIPDTVMGLTFVAAGVSVPDALSSIAVIKEGYGDMAVSNAVGSNVFDILVCLGLPWLLHTTIYGGAVNVLSKGLTYSTLSLLSTVVFLLMSVHLNGWKLDRRLGVVLMLWYILFITVASMYELNVFGMMNKEDCPTTW